MTARKILILTEGGGTKGFGHLARCSALADAFSQKKEAVTFLVDGDESVKGVLSGYDFRIVDWLKLKAQLQNEVRHAEMCILDSYAASAKLCARFGVMSKLTVYIDDNKRINYPHGVVVNPNIYAPQLPYRSQKACRYFLGAEYALLRRPFWSIGAKKINTRIKNIMITFGGSDDLDRTSKIVDLLQRAYPELVKHIVVGKGFKPGNIKKLQGSSGATIKLIYYPDADKMKAVMARCDIAVSAAGQTIYELAASGLPAVIVGVADNQKRNVAAWEKCGFLTGDIVKNIARLMPQKTRRSISRKIQKIVNGRGALRVADRLLTLLKEQEALRVRPMVLADCRNAWVWRNSPKARAQSRDQRPIPYQKHKVWFADKIKDKAARMYMVENKNGEQIGQVRFDIDGRASLVSVSLNPAYYGMGFGRRVIESATGKFIKEASGVDKVVAQIKPENLPSVKAFMKAGYKLEDNIIIGKAALGVYAFRR